MSSATFGVLRPISNGHFGGSLAPCWPDYGPLRLPQLVDDLLCRVTEVTYPDPQTDAYTYDPVGNRLTRDTDDYTYDAADQLTDLEGTSYDYDANGNQTSRGSDTFTYDHENRLTQAVIEGTTSTSTYNGAGLRISHTVDTTTTDYIWDLAAGLPVVLQDGTNTYVHGLDLISTTDGAGVQTYQLYDGLGSTTDLTDGSAIAVDGYTYDVFGALKSQNGNSDNYWLFTGEQLDAEAAAVGGSQRLPLDVVVSSTNLTGATVDNLDDDPDAPDANWATATSVADTSIQVGFPTPPGDPTPGADLQEFRVLLRKDAAGGNDPTYDIELWETSGGAPLATLVSGATVSSDTGEVVSATWEASLLGTADGSAVELVVVGHRSGGNPSKRRTVEVGALEWNVQYGGSPPGGLYYLRARYYDPETGRFLGQDALPAANPYAYVANNPTNLIDSSGLCHERLGWDQMCGRWAHELEPDADQEDTTPNESYTGGDDADERGEDTEGTMPDPGDAYYCSLDPLCARSGVGGQVSFECAAFGRDCYSQEHLRKYPPLPREAAEPSECEKAIGQLVLFDVVPSLALFGIGRVVKSAHTIVKVTYNLANAGSTASTGFDLYDAYQACK